MASLATNVSDLATRVGSELKAHKVLINGNAEGLGDLDTTAKTNLVAAINEVNASIASASGIDDAATSPSSSWSSSKTSTEIAAAKDRANHTGSQAASTVDETSTRKWLSDTERIKLSGVAAGATANASNADLRDRSTHTGTQSVDTLSDFEAALAGLKDEILGGAGSAVDTLQELATLIEDNADLIASLETVAANKVSFDEQSLTSPQQAQARANIGAASSADVAALSTTVGTVTDGAFVAAFESAIA